MNIKGYDSNHVYNITIMSNRQTLYSPDEGPGKSKHCLDPESGMDNIQMLKILSQPKQ